eukprot:1887150-Amphidinium_carterae.1
MSLWEQPRQMYRLQTALELGIRPGASGQPQGTSYHSLERSLLLIHEQLTCSLMLILKPESKRQAHQCSIRLAKTSCPADVWKYNEVYSSTVNTPLLPLGRVVRLLGLRVTWDHSQDPTLLVNRGASQQGTGGMLFSDLEWVWQQQQINYPSGGMMESKVLPKSVSRTNLSGPISVRNIHEVCYVELTLAGT